MASFNAISCLTTFFALSIVPTAHAYTYTTNAMVTNVYDDAGYVPEDYVKRWLAEGDAICEAFTQICNLFPNTFENGGIEFIVASTGGNTSTYIYGLAKKLMKFSRFYRKPSKIIVVYTLNYVAGDLAAQEHREFKNALQKLDKAVKAQYPKIELVVKQFRPVQGNTSTLVPTFDYKDYSTTTMTNEQVEAQREIIDKLHIETEEVEIITSVEFRKLLKDSYIRKIVDGVVGSGIKTVDCDNQLLTAIPRAQIRIMASAIKALKRRRGGVLVISNDNPSGMDKNGSWTIDAQHLYPVDIILSCVWHKKLVNSADLKGRREALALDITYNEKRLFNILLDKIKAADNPNQNLIDDVKVALGEVIEGELFASYSKAE